MAINGVGLAEELNENLVFLIHNKVHEVVCLDLSVLLGIVHSGGRRGKLDPVFAPDYVRR